MTEEWIKTMWFIITVEYYSTLNKNEILMYAVTPRDFEDIMLNEISQTQNDTYHMTLLI